MVFVGNGGAKQGHNAVAEHLVHRALEAVHGVHHAVQGRIEELLGGFGIEAADEFGGVFEVGKEHRDLLALAFQGGAGGQDLLGEMGWRIGRAGPLRCAGLHQCRRRRLAESRGAADPDQHGVVLVHRYLLHLDKFELDILEVRLIQVELAFEGTIRDPALALEQGDGLVQDLLEGHGRPSGWVYGAR